MNQDYIIPNEWSIIEQGFDKENVCASESLFSLGNGAMGQRANFEETYTGNTFQGSYIAGVYYPDKTRVGWWKNGYPEYFAKVLNSPNWIGIEVRINGQILDLNTAQRVSDFKRELDMQQGVYTRSFRATLPQGEEIEVQSVRFLSLTHNELGAIRYRITPLSGTMHISVTPYLDAGIKNHDTNWDDKFWEVHSVQAQQASGFILSETLKTHFSVCTFMHNDFFVGNQLVKNAQSFTEDLRAGITFTAEVPKGETATLYKYAGYVTSLNHPKDALQQAAQKVIDLAQKTGFDALLAQQKKDWAEIWQMADITIEGDTQAQQGIRFNIFQLNQTYLGTDPRLNIGPKGFTGEKYGGSTYWDTEAYCLPFYMATKNQNVARNLLVYRYNHLEKAIENAQKLGFTSGAALYPMVTMNGEECHNEWEITFEEIHRNGAIAFAIYNYVRYTGDEGYIPEKGLEVLIGIARFWHQRANFSQEKGKYVILGVTGPNEYENNVNNNWYTNYLAAWCIRYAQEQIQRVEAQSPADYQRIVQKTKLSAQEIAQWAEVAQNMYYPYSPQYEVFLQQDGFLDKTLTPVSELKKSERPINQHWSWDRILRSPYIKQADTLQGFYFFEEDFSPEQLEKHFSFYEPLTVHESSLSPCVHSILAASLGRMQQAYEFYLRTSRLDLDDYNKEVHEGLHITSMAGTWLSIVEGFGGLRVKNHTLTLNPKLPEQWQGYSFKINFRERIVQVSVSPQKVEVQLLSGAPLQINVYGKPYEITTTQSANISR